MTIKGLDQDGFNKKLRYFLSPSSPIRTIELLRGRTDQIKQARHALNSPGRNVFIYGDRGVGKTSLALTVANLEQSSDKLPIFVACDKTTTLYGLIKDIASNLLSESPIFQGTTKTAGASAGLGSYLSLELSKSIQEGKVPIPNTLNEAVQLIQYGSSLYSDKTIIVVDEFERISNQAQRSMFGDFIKQLGDQDVQAKFIFSGIGGSLTNLLDSHESSFRYLASIKLDKLDWEARQDIILGFAKKLGIHIENEYLYRIASISDGYPHYVHLIGEKLFLAVFENPIQLDRINSDVFIEAVNNAVKDVEHHLQQLWVKATKKYTDEYQEILWAVVDHPDEERRSSEIYESYKRIATLLKKEPLERKTFDNRMNKLKTEAHGNVLSGTRSGWYSFKEPMLRGYARLLATKNSVELDIMHGLQPKTIDVR